MEKNYHEIFRNVLLLCITGLVSIGVYIFSGFNDSLKSMELSVKTLNIQIARILEREQNQQKANEYFATRIKELEEKTQDRWSRTDHKNYSDLINSRFNTLMETYEKRFQNVENKIK